MDNIKEKIEEIVGKVKSDKEFASEFKKDPIKAVEGIIGIDLPDEKIKDIINAVKTKIKLDDSKIIDKVKGLFK